MNLSEVKKAKENKEAVYFDKKEVYIIDYYENFNLVDISFIDEDTAFTVDMNIVEKIKE